MRNATPAITRAKKAVRFTVSVEVTERSELLELLLVDHDGLDALGSDALVETVPFGGQPVAKLRDHRLGDAAPLGKRLLLAGIGGEVEDLERAALEVMDDLAARLETGDLHVARAGPVELGVHGPGLRKHRAGIQARPVASLAALRSRKARQAEQRRADVGQVHFRID